MFLHWGQVSSQCAKPYQEKRNESCILRLSLWYCFQAGSLQMEMMGCATPVNYTWNPRVISMTSPRPLCLMVGCGRGKLQKATWPVSWNDLGPPEEVVWSWCISLLSEWHKATTVGPVAILPSLGGLSTNLLNRQACWDSVKQQSALNGSVSTTLASITTVEASVSLNQTSLDGVDQE